MEQTNIMSLEEAVDKILSYIEEIKETEMLPLIEANGRILAEDLKATFSNPPFDRSAMDGYAVRAEDLIGASREHPVTLSVLTEVDAGMVSRFSLKAGQAIRIMTGAQIPPGCDCIIRQEDTDYGESEVLIYREGKPFENSIFKGHDFQEGDVLLSKGCRLGYIEQGIAASLGLTQVPVYRLPRIAVFTTGDEIVPPGQPLPPGKIYNSNEVLVVGRLMELGIRPFLVQTLSDDPAEVAAAIRKVSRKVDLILTTGGVSVGKKDILHPAISLLGAERIFWKLALKPGMPTLFSVLTVDNESSSDAPNRNLTEKHQKKLPILSLSGSPFAVIVTLETLLRPALSKMTYNPGLLPVKVQGILATPYHKKAKIRRLLRGRYEHGVVTLPKDKHENGTLSSASGCNCLVDLSDGPGEIPAGKMVTFFFL